MAARSNEGLEPGRAPFLSPNTGEIMQAVSAPAKGRVELFCDMLCDVTPRKVAAICACVRKSAEAVPKGLKCPEPA